MREFEHELTRKEYKFCEQLMKDAVNNPTKQMLYTSYMHLACVLQKYNELTLQKGKADWFNYYSSKTTIDVNTLEVVQFRYSSFKSFKNSSNKKERDEYELYHTQKVLLYNMYRNEIGDCESLKDYATMFFYIRNNLAHEPSALIKGSAIYRLLDSKFPSPEFVEKLTMHVLDSDIGYNYMAEVIKFFRNEYPKGYEKKKETTDIFSEHLSLDESVTTIHSRH